MRNLLLATGAALASVSMTPVRAQQITYQYDALGRLTGTSVSGGVSSGVMTTYTYDRAGNRTLVRVTGVPTPTPAPAPPPTPSPTATPGTVSNWSFEEPQVGAAFQYNGGTADYYFGGLSGVAGNGSAWGFPAAPDGTQEAFLQNTSGNGGPTSISMVVRNLTPNATYVVRFQMSMRLYFPANRLHVAISGASAIDLGYVTPSAVAWQPVTTTQFTANASTMVLSFAGTTPGDSGTGIDRVVVAAP